MDRESAFCMDYDEEAVSRDQDPELDAEGEDDEEWWALLKGSVAAGGSTWLIYVDD